MMDNPGSHESSPAPIRYAGFWVRVLASFIDSFLYLLVFFPLIIPLVVFQGKPSFALSLYDFLISWIFPAVLVLLFWKYKGATPGKMIFSIRIIKADEASHPSTPRFLGRYLAYFISLIPLGLGYLWVAWDPKKQGWHDKIAGTVVIKAPRSEKAVLSQKKALKVILSVLLFFLILFVLLISWGIYWLSKNKDALLNNFSSFAVSVQQEATQFAEGRDNEACLEEALVRFDRCDSFPCHLRNNIFLAQCLQASQATPGFCEEVPPRTDIFKTAAWRVNECDKAGREGNFCHELFGTVQKFCHGSPLVGKPEPKTRR